LDYKTSDAARTTAAQQQPLLQVQTLANNIPRKSRNKRPTASSSVTGQLDKHGQGQISSTIYSGPPSSVLAAKPSKSQWKFNNSTSQVITPLLSILTTISILNSMSNLILLYLLLLLLILK
jgi:hypothetical protein